LGVLFRSTQLSKVKQNLLIFIKATIIKDPEKARKLSHRKYNFMRDVQLEQVKEDLQYIPVLDPLE
jgi:general secretion pathway protein D